MGLERHDDSAMHGSRGCKHRRDLRRVVTVVVNHKNAHRLATHLEPTLRALLPDPSVLRFGVRVTMPASDPLRRVLGNDWQQEHWFATRDERNAALEEMGKRHTYSRIGDAPSILLKSIER